MPRIMTAQSARWSISRTVINWVKVLREAASIHSTGRTRRPAHLTCMSVPSITTGRQGFPRQTPSQSIPFHEEFVFHGPRPCPLRILLYPSNSTVGHHQSGDERDDESDGLYPAAHERNVAHGYDPEDGHKGYHRCYRDGLGPADQ